MERCKNYKPEILLCPKCNTKLVYRHAVSNKMVYFTSGKRVRIKNLGYSCPNCKDNQIYISQTANKLSFKGYTYSAKIVCMIAKLKDKHMSRDEICDYFFSKNIDMSDRNVDNLYQKYLECVQLDSSKKIEEAYEAMLCKYNQIRLAIDLITICGTAFVVVYDYFTSEMLALKRFENINVPEVKEFFEGFLKPYLNITVIATIRRDAVFVPMLKRLCPSNTKFIPFSKF